MLAAFIPFKAVDFAHGLGQQGAGELVVEVHGRAQNGGCRREKHLLDQPARLWSGGQVITVDHVVHVGAQITNCSRHFFRQQAQQVRNFF